MKNKKEVYLCSISNIESGTCKEDCKFCTQSIKNDIDIFRYKRKYIQDIVSEAKLAKLYKAQGFCLVTAGKEMTDSKLRYVIEAAHAIKKENLGLKLSACNGLATLEQLKELKKAGVDIYNHNLETSKEFYSKLCTTHNWEERYETCLNVKEAGLDLACGGIFGVGETEIDRDSLFKSIKSLNPIIVSLNFYHYVEDLPIKKNILTREEAFSIISKAKELVPMAKVIMVGGGRESMFGNKQFDILKYGANSFIIGGYLTTFAGEARNDLTALKKLGYEIGSL